MPREIIHVQVGQCGNQVGTAFWEQVVEEHNLATDGLWKGDHKTFDDEDGDGTVSLVSRLYFTPFCESPCPT